MEWLFLAVSFIAVLAAGMMLTRQNAVHSALFLILNFGCVAFLYLMLDAPFLAMVQVTVYTGAIMVLFLFVIMLLGAEVTTDTSGRMRWLSFAATGAALLTLVIFGFPIASDLLANDGPNAAGQAQLRVINAIPPDETRQFTVLEAGFEAPLEGQVSATVRLETDGAAAVEFVDIVYDEPRQTMRGYTEVSAADYTLTVTVSDGNYQSSPIWTENLSLAPDDARSVALYENSGGQVDMLLLTDDVAAPAVGKMRLTLFNAVADAQVSLVDIGQYTAIRSLCENSSCDSLLPHRTLIEELPPGDHIAIELDQGSYNLAFVDQNQDILRNLPEYQAERGQVETRILVREPSALGGQASYRAAVFSAPAQPAFGSPESIGQVLFVDYVLPVQLVGLLLLVALIGVIVLAAPDALAQAKRRRTNRRRRVSQPLASVISQQTGANVLRGDDLAKLPEGADDPPNSRRRE